MAFEADKVVVELIAKVDQFDQPVKQSASTFDANMAKISASATKAEQVVQRSAASRSQAIQRESAQISQFTKSLATDMIGVGNLMTAANSPFVVPVREAPTVTKAIGGVSTAVGALGGVMGTVAAVGVSLLIAALVDFISKSRGANTELDDMVGKLKEHAEKTKLSEEAQRIFARTVEGSIEAMRKLTDEIDKQNLTLEDNIALKKAALAGALSNTATNIGGVSTDLAAAVARYREAQQFLQSVQSGKFLGENPAATLLAAEGRAAAARQQVADLTAQLVALNRAAEDGARAIRAVDFPLLERGAKEAVDPIAAINRRYDDMAKSAEKAARGNDSLKRSLAGTLVEIEKQRKAALDAARPAGASGLGGRQISFADAAAIARGAGFNVTSAYRSTAHQAELYNDPSVNRPGNPVAKPGTSAHEGVNGKWALDIAFAPGLTPQGIRKLYGDQGVSLSAVYKEAGHFHIEGSRSQAASAENAAARAAERQLRADKQHQDQIDRLLMAEQDVTIEVGKQRDLTIDLGGSILEAAAAEDALRQHIALVAAEMDEVNQFGGELIDQVLNPDNWKNWGDTAKSVLHEIALEILKLGAVNPLKNLLSGGNLPTLLGTFGSLFGGGFDQQGFALTASSNATALGLPSDFFRAAGGPVGAGQAYVVGENGPETFVPSTSGMIIPSGGAPRPSNDRAASPYGGMGGDGGFRVEVVPSEYFDVRVSRIAGPMVAEGSIRAAAGGSSLALGELGRNAMHRLE